MAAECLLDLKLKSKISVTIEFSERNAPISWRPLVTGVLGSPGAVQGLEGTPGLHLPKVGHGEGPLSLWSSKLSNSSHSGPIRTAFSLDYQPHSALRDNPVKVAGMTEGEPM